MLGRATFFVLGVTAAFVAPQFLSQKSIPADVLQSHSPTGTPEFSKWWGSVRSTGNDPGSSYGSANSYLDGSSYVPSLTSHQSTMRSSSATGGLLARSDAAPNYATVPNNLPVPTPYYPPTQSAQSPNSSFQGTARPTSAAGTPATNGWVTGQPPWPGQTPAASQTSAAVTAAREGDQNLEQMFRFDIEPGWITQQWPRVSTQLYHENLYGMRVPLVSGTDSQDLAGSLSYYFDQSQQLQRVSFEGSTGDPTRLIALLSKNHGLRAEPSLGGGMYVARDPTQPTSIKSVLRLRQTPIVRQSQPLQRYLVKLELNRPGTDRLLSQELRTLLGSDIRSKLWKPQPVAPKDTTGSPLAASPPAAKNVSATSTAARAQAPAWYAPGPTSPMAGASTTTPRPVSAPSVRHNPTPVPSGWPAAAPSQPG